MWKGCCNNHGIYTHKIIWQTFDSVLVPLELIPFDPNKQNRAIEHVNLKTSAWQRSLTSKPALTIHYYVHIACLQVIVDLTLIHVTFEKIRLHGASLEDT